MNELLKKKTDIDKLQVALYTRGMGVILFAAWSFLRVFIMDFGSTDAAEASMQFSPVKQLIIDFISGALNAWFQIYVGRSAISFSKEGKLYRGSLFLAGFFAITPLAILVLYFFIAGIGSLTLSQVAGAIVDIAITILNTQIIIYTLRLKKARA